MEKMKLLMISLLSAALTSYLGTLLLPFGLLVVCNLMDYVTGLLAAPRRGEQRSSSRGFAGIAKKIGIWGLVAVGVVVDLLLNYLAGTLGWATPLPMMVACLATVWLLGNELLSIIENIGDLGVEVPFLRQLVRWMKKKAEDAVPKDGEEDEDGMP